MSSSGQSALSTKDTLGSRLLWAVLALAVCLVAISSQSLWIDEAFTAAKATQTTLGGWWHAMFTGKGSDLQMPLYMIYVWGFAKIFGYSEWALRAANIPWFILGTTAFISAFPKPRRFAAAAIALLSPFAWEYLDEARPYAMQLGVSLVIFASVSRLIQFPLAPAVERRCIAAFCAAIIVLCGSSLLGVIWSGAAVFCLAFLVSRDRLIQLLRAHWLSFCFLCAALALLGLYFLWTLKVGARASSAGKTNASNAVFIVYELLGFSGLGPGRLDIRGGGLAVFKPFVLPLLCYTGVTCFIIAASIAGIWKKSDHQRFGAVLLALAAPSALLLLAGVALHFRVLGRHFIPLLPVVWFLLCKDLFSGSRFRNLTGVIFFILSLASCLSLRFASRHEKDDYRDAAVTANSALSRGQKVWWNASDDGAAYYHLSLATEAAGQGRALLILNPTLQSLSSFLAPDVIITTSKPDIYDNQHAIERYIRNNPYVQTATYPAFSVWQRKSSQAPQ
jgi:hypothetical protein